ncbi:hypothetical protein ACS0PU_007793 [Formica fusca]
MLQGGTFDRVSPRKLSVESLKASVSTTGSCCKCYRYTRYMYVYTHTYSVQTHIHTHRGIVHILFHNALNATGSTSEIIRSEECIRLSVLELEKEWERRTEIRPRYSWIRIHIT